ncbi:wax ester synthase/diacylglycerol acyltransferase 11-like isoform X2 [Andrographis paniculata]|uniref:wax ester synthase/diacylglycerol acyltransferase 11-like isoform X2 n=1 Tax=Andrographis paniculata TaxID=175694 RepID=UPI0021E7804B|nr:wax ester synthase/diacylglycerol acyltransferase 11-like isoform X2 [Andrographis paniculata]
MGNVEVHEEEEEEEEEAVSPSSSLMQQPKFNLYILALMGFQTAIDVPLFKLSLSQTLIHHPRFSSLLVNSNNGARRRMRWKRVRVDVDSHVFAPDLDPEMDGPDTFVEDFTADLSKTPMDRKKPLWEVYILNVPTADAAATAVFKIDHSVGDGASLISLVLACSRKISDPQALPEMPVQKKPRPLSVAAAGSPAGLRSPGIVKWALLLTWTLLLTIFHTVADGVAILATVAFVKDKKTPIKGSAGVEASPKRFVHRIVSLDDFKLVKTAMNVSINDVALAVTEAGVSRYLKSRYDNVDENGASKKKFNVRNGRMRIGIAFNLRPPPTIQIP